MISGESFLEGCVGIVHFPNISAADFRLFLRFLGVRSIEISDPRVSSESVAVDHQESLSTDDEGAWEFCLVCRRVGAKRNSENLRRTCENVNTDKLSTAVDDFEDVDESLRSLLAVVQFAHQYLFDLTSDDIVASTGASSIGVGSLLRRAVALVSRVFVDHYRHVRMSTLRRVIESFRFIFGGDEDDNVCGGKSRLEQRKRASARERRLDAIVADAVAASARLLETCVGFLPFIDPDQTRLLGTHD